ncbi:MAG: vanadium-dependent haloperoxidase [Pseudomonadota bacterium]
MKVGLISACVLMAGCASLTVATEARDGSRPNAAVQWNAAVLEVGEQEDGFLTLKGLRTTAMMHLAMHDALSLLNGRFATFACDANAGKADPVAAASHAARTVAASQYPDAADHFDALNARLQPAGLGTTARRDSERLGAACARAVIKAREGDGWDTDAQYSWHPMAPGVYAEFREHSGTPEGFVFGAGWANARGFALSAPDQFRAPPPPAIDSAAYTTAFDEVKQVGRFQSMTRTNDQTHLALWWKDFAESSHNRLARDLVVRRSLDLAEATRLFSLINMAIFDAYVSSFDNKFHFNHWRPYTAIRWADNDGNPDTQVEATWTNTHRHTYAFPSYPSAHGTACAAAMQAFATVYGDNYAFTMRTDTVDIAGPFSGKIEMHPPTRSFKRFSDAADECGLSRVYLGIHFRYDSVEGVALGIRVGDNLVQTLLRPTAPEQ